MDAHRSHQRKIEIERRQKKKGNVHRPSRMGERVEGETFVLSKERKTRLERKKRERGFMRWQAGQRTRNGQTRRSFSFRSLCRGNQHLALERTWLCSVGARNAERMISAFRILPSCYTARPPRMSVKYISRDVRQLSNSTFSVVIRRLSFPGTLKYHQK